MIKSPLKTKFMADVKISELTEANLPLDGTEDLPIVEGGVTKRCSTQDIADLNVKTVKVSLSSAQILTLGTAINLIAAPGAGKMIDVLKVFLRLNFVTTAYDTNTAVTLYLGTPTLYQLTGSSTGFLANTSTTMVQPAMQRYLSAFSSIQSNFENQPVTIVSGGNPANGDSTVDVWITYQIINI